LNWTPNDDEKAKQAGFENEMSWFFESQDTSSDDPEDRFEAISELKLEEFIRRKYERILGARTKLQLVSKSK